MISNHIVISLLKFKPVIQKIGVTTNVEYSLMVPDFQFLEGVTKVY